MYRIIGSDGREYGPVDGAQIRTWILEGRLIGESRILREGAADWGVAGEFPEFAGAFAREASPEPFRGSSPIPAGPLPIHDGDYRLDVFGCVEQGWKLMTGQFSTVFPAMLLYMAILFAIGLLGIIPFIGPVFSLGQILIAGPLMGGLYLVFIRAMHAEPTGAGDVFAGFRNNWGQLVLSQVVISLFILLCMSPLFVVMMIVLVPTVANGASPTPIQIASLAGMILIFMSLIIWLLLNWMFALPLIAERNLKFWPAMQASWRQVSRHWFTLFGLMIVLGFLNILGFLLCGVGFLFTACISHGAVVAAYETLFRPREQEKCA